MPESTSAKTERMANKFVWYMGEKYHSSKHVLRVATWIGFILKGIEGVAGASLDYRRTRQVSFRYKRRTFKAKYNHHAGLRGGIDIVEVLPGRGAPEGELAVRIRNLGEAEDVYLTLKERLDRFIAQQRGV